MASSPEGTAAGRKALVTGGGRGIGRAIALALAREGADVAVAARSSGQTSSVAREVEALGRKSAGLTADVTKLSEVRTMAAAAARALGSIDILVNCAGDAESAPLIRTEPDLWDRMIAVNLTSVYQCTRELLPGMVERGWGRVINVSSSAGLAGHAYVSAYCAAKHGVVGFTRAVALEVGVKGVTVNALCPGYVDTEMTHKSAERVARLTGLSQERALAQLARFNPSGRLIAPEEVGAAAVRLASAEGSAINGEAVTFD